MKKLLFASVLLLASTIVVNAQVRTLKGEKQKIKNGVVTGQLTKPEAIKLKNQTAALRTEKNIYKSDGVITPTERRDLKKDNRRLNANIFKQKHDRQKRG